VRLAQSGRSDPKAVGLFLPLIIMATLPAPPVHLVEGDAPLRRKTILGLIAGAMGLVLLAPAACTPSAGKVSAPKRRAQPRPQRPNIMIVVTDDQALHSMSVMPETRRWLVQGGTRFPNAFVTTPQCCPSRSSILTGRYAHNHGVHDNSQGKRLDQRSTLERYLQEAGYRTAIFGKFLNSFGIYRNPPYWNRWATTRSTQPYYNSTWNVNGRVRKISKYANSFMSDKALHFVTSSKRPWFLYLAARAPHAPFTAAPRFRYAPVPQWHGNPAVLERDRNDKPPYVRAGHISFRQGKALRKKQLRTLMSVDEMLGRLHRALVRHGEIRNTLVVFLSDNGMLWGEYGRIGKAVPYTPSVKVPLFMSWPGNLRADATDSRIAANIDIAPTVLDAAGVNPQLRYPVDGKSLLEKRWKRERILTEFWHRHFQTKAGNVPKWASDRTPTYQYVEYYAADGKTVTFKEYYNLTSDPWELDNLLDDGNAANDPSPATLVRLHRELQHDRMCAGTKGVRACP
jgi:arylsulfatase A-like enzyme